MIFFRWSRISVDYPLPEVDMYDLLYYMSGLFLRHLNTLETLKLGTSYVTSFPAYFCSVIVYSDLSSSVENILYTSAEYFCNKFSLTMLCFYLSLFAEEFCDKVSLTMLRSDPLTSL